MSASEIQVGQDVTFTLDIANAKAGDVLTLEFCADSGKYTEEFTLTYPDNVFTHEFSQDGNRSICFRVVGGEYCAAQTLIVEASKAGIDSAKLSISNLSVVEKAEGETIRATVTCNNQTGVAELYVGSAKNYASSDDYDVVDGRRVFEVEVTLGGNGKSYAGDYKIWVNALKGAYQAVDATYNLGTLKVTHAYTTQSEPAGSYYEKSANGHTLYNKTKITETCSVCGDQKETTQKKPAGNEEPHVGLTENGKCSVCGWKKGALQINNKVQVDNDDRLNSIDKGKAGISTPHYYYEAGVVGSSAEDLEKVIKQFNVEKFYQPDGSYYCTTYAATVARAMGAFLPTSYDCIHRGMCIKCGKPINGIANDYNGMYEYLKSKGLTCNCAAAEKAEAWLFVTSKQSWNEVVTDKRGDLARWLLEHGSEFGWKQVVTQTTVEEYRNIPTQGEKLSKDVTDAAIRYALEGKLVIGVYSDYQKGSGHAFLVYPNGDTKELYTAQAGGKRVVRENKPNGHDSYVNEETGKTEYPTRGSNDKWIRYFVFDGIA